MALLQRYQTQAEIPASLAEHYSEHDGVWLLQTDPAIEDVSGLKTALSNERNLRREGEKKLTDMQVRFEGIDPDEVHKLRERVKGLDDSEVYDRQGIEALVLKRTESMKTEHERQLNAVKRENDQLKATAADLDKRWRQDRIKTALQAAVAEAGVFDKAHGDAVQRGMAVFTDLDEAGNVISKNGDDVRYGKDGVNPLTPQEWISSLKASGQAPHLWPSSSGSGAPAQHGANGAGIDWASLPPTERATRFREYQAQQQRR